MSIRKYFFSVEQIEQSMPTVSPSKLSNGDWGVWLDSEQIKEIEQLPHNFCQVEAKSGKSWMVEVGAAPDTEFQRGAKFPAPAVKQEQLEAWLERHTQHYERIRADVEGDMISESLKAPLRKEFAAYMSAKMKNLGQGRATSDQPPKRRKESWSD